MESETPKVIVSVRRSAKQLTPEQRKERSERFAKRSQDTLQLLSMNHALVIKGQKATKK